MLRYLAAWNLAAEQGIVPASANLTTGEDLDLDVDQLPNRETETVTIVKVSANRFAGIFRAVTQWASSLAGRS